MKNTNFNFRIFCISMAVMVAMQIKLYAQTSPIQSGEIQEFEGFSGFMVPAMRATRGETLKFEEIIPFSKGPIKAIDFSKQYLKIFLGADFAEIAFKEKSCSQLKSKLVADKAGYVPISDGNYFSVVSLNNLADLEGYYKFQNNNFLPGILAEATIYVKIEGHQFGNSVEKNCMLIKFLIPEVVKDKQVENTYLLRSDGVLAIHPMLEDPEFKKHPDFSNHYCLFPLKDNTETTHIVGKDFHVLGSFAKQSSCDRIQGLLFPTSRKGEPTGCIFFRKVAGVPEKFVTPAIETGSMKK